jgi:serine/threonine-protein kinase RsbW
VASAPCGYADLVRITLSLCLPRDERTVALARHLIEGAMVEVGVAKECRTDVAVALSEASANVVKHSGPGDEYEVSCEVTEERCVIRVIDAGHGFDQETLAYGRSGLDEERGRGIQLMRALVDQVRFLSRPEEGTIVHLEKLLEYEHGSPMTSLRPGR